MISKNISNVLLLSYVILMVYLVSVWSIKDGLKAIKSGKKDMQLRDSFGGGIIKIRGKAARIAGIVEILFMGSLLIGVTVFLLYLLFPNALWSNR